MGPIITIQQESLRNIPTKFQGEPFFLKLSLLTSLIILLYSFSCQLSIALFIFLLTVNKFLHLSILFSFFILYTILIHLVSRGAAASKFIFYLSTIVISSDFRASFLRMLQSLSWGILHNNSAL